MESDIISPLSTHKSGTDSVITFGPLSLPAGIDKIRRESVYSKLDVLRATQINLLTRVNIAVVTFAVLYSITAVVLTRNNGSTVQNMVGAPEIHLSKPGYTSIGGFALLDAAIWMLQVLTFYVIVPMYLNRVFQNNEIDLTEEQWIVSSMLLLNFLYSNPVHTVVQLVDAFTGTYSLTLQVSKFNWYHTTNIWSYIFYHLCWSALAVFYIWVRIRSFHAQPTAKKSSRFFKESLPRLLCCLIRWSVIIYFKITDGRHCSFIPFATLTAIVKASHATVSWHRPEVLCASILSAVECIILVGIIFELWKCIKSLKSKDYFLFRSRLVSFRFFIFHTSLHFGSMIIIGVITAAYLPSVRTVAHQFYYGKMYYRGAISTLQWTWLLIIAWISLPYDSIGLRGWRESCYLSDAHNRDRMDEAEAISLSLVEREPITNPAIFCFYDHTKMLNFAWLACCNSKDKFELFSLELCNTYTVKVIDNEDEEIRVVVASLPERIVLSFRGMNSANNIKTLMKVPLSRLDKFLPTRALGNKEHPRNTIKAWMRAKIHRGFAKAYKSISNQLLRVVDELLAQTMRPVFCTGHGFGGCLATICAFDLLTSGLPISSSQITVSTFGSPKCGERNWASIYNSIVRNHWNIAIESDVISKIPGLFYVHVGKTAVLTSTGDLLLDPSILENWNVVVRNLKDHKKTSYKLALMIVCVKHLDGIESGICNFPVKQKHVRDWEKRCGIEFSEQIISDLLASKSSHSDITDATNCETVSQDSG